MEDPTQESCEGRFQGNNCVSDWRLQSEQVKGSGRDFLERICVGKMAGREVW